MNWFLKALWLFGGWIAGSFITSACISTVIITLSCSLKLWKILKSYTDYWNPNACKTYLLLLALAHLFISICVSGLVIWLCPKPAIFGYFFGIVLTLLLGIKSMGVNEDNISDTLRIFRKYTYPGKEDSLEKMLIVKTYMGSL